MATIAQAAHSLEYAYRTARYTSGGADSVYTWMRTVADLMWQAALTFDGPSVDTMRVAVVRLHALADADTALERARTIADATMRERAIGYALRRIAAYDAEGADEMAAILQDSIARSMVYEELTRRAVAGGWLRDAARLAQQTPRGPARAAALHAAASAEMEAGRVATARELLLLLLQDLDPELSCNDCQRDAPYQIRPPDPGMVVKLALQAGLEEQLDRWASGRDTPRARAAAWIAVAEGVAAARRRWVR
jgi:hypothetical protein